MHECDGIFTFYFQDGGESDDNASNVTSGNHDTNLKVIAEGSGQGQKAVTPGKRLKGRKSRRSGRSEWEIIEGLRDGQKFEKVPEKFMGYLSKRKRWPMKGWHKVGGTSFTH